MKANINIKTVREYCGLILDGKPKKEAALEVFGTRSAVPRVENSDDFRIIYQALQDRHTKELENEVEKIQKQKLRAYSKLLSSAEEMIENAATTEEKLQAQENQRRNLDVQLVEQAEGWNSLNRNKEKSDVLEGILID